MRHVTKGRNDVITYLDGMLVSHTRLTEHIQGADQILERVRKCGLTIRLTKSCIAVKEVGFLGYTIKESINNVRSIFG